MIVLLLAAALAGEAPPPPRYLAPAQVREALLERAPALVACGEGQPEGAWRLDLAVRGDGALTPVRLQPGPDGVAPPEGLDACLAAALAASPIAPHHEDPIAVRGTVLVRGGRVALGPVLDVAEHRADLLFLHLPPALPATERAALLRLLGLPVPEQVGG